MIQPKSKNHQNGTAPLQLSGLLVQPEWLAQHLDHPELRLLDIRLQDSYKEEHLPRAVWVDYSAITGLVNGIEGMLLPPEPFAAYMGRLGVTQDQVVVVYDDNWGMPATRLLWSLARYGHQQVAVLNGGWDRWQAEDRPVSDQASIPAESHFTIRPADDQLAERTWLLDHLGDPGLVLVDTRTPVEYSQGHLPGAIQWDWMNGVPLDSWDTIRPVEELRAELASLGITPDKEIVTYCRSGARAAHTYLLLRQLGYPRVRNYDGSWLEWSRYPQPQFDLEKGEIR